MLKAIFVVAGHGKSGGTPEKKYQDATVDPGAVGNGTTERAEVLQIARETFERIGQDPDLKHLSRFLLDEDVTLSQKIDEVNDIMKDLNLSGEDACLVDIHLNSAASPEARGCETWYGKNDKSDFAKIVLEEVIRATGFPQRAVKSSDANRHGRLGILDDTKPQACLIECGFLTNEFESGFIKDEKLDDLFSIGLHHAIRRQAGFPGDVGLPSAGFRDVPDGSWFSPHVKKLVDLGVIDMAADQLFHPEAPVNRAEMAKMLSVLADKLSTRL